MAWTPARSATAGSLAVAFAAGLLACGSASAAPCSLIASPTGSDRASGTLARPFRTVQRLADRLSPGQIGCLRRGVYREDVKIKHGGRSATQRLTIESYEGERATLIGRLYLRRGSNHVTITRINLNGRNRSALPSPTINSEDAEFSHDDVTNEHTGICFILGSAGFGRARRTIISANRIHDCGVEPSHNQDHGIYIAESDGAQITDNVIFKNADRAIQLFPDAQGTVIEHNIIDQNGEGITFSGHRRASSNTLVEFNLITNARIRYDVESFYPRGAPAGVNNVVRNNCVYGGAHGTIGEEVGYSAAGFANKRLDPRYANPSAGDYAPAPSSPCAAYVLAETPVNPF